MTRVLLVLPAMALLGAAPAAPPVFPQASPTRVISPVPSTCKQIDTFAQGDNQRPGLKRLGELPPAQAFMAVYRTDEKGCLDPMLASERQGYRAPR